MDIFAPDPLRSLSAGSSDWSVLCGSAVRADSAEEGEDGEDKCHERAAQSLLKLAQENRGVYIKLGQHASAMTYLLPPVYTRTLSVLQVRRSSSLFLHSIKKFSIELLTSSALLSIAVSGVSFFFFLPENGVLLSVFVHCLMPRTVGPA